jgi:hypothetical protein
MALLHELGNDCLLQRRRLAIDEIARTDKGLQQRARHHRIAEAPTGKQRFVERADVDHLLRVIEPLRVGVG